jgi:hypothetical protein
MNGVVRSQFTILVYVTTIFIGTRPEIRFTTDLILPEICGKFPM